MAPPLSTIPMLWETVDPHTQQELAGLFLNDMSTTTPGTGLAALIAAAAVFIQDNFHPPDWGPISYDMNMQLQTMLLAELQARAGARPPGVDPPDDLPVIDLPATEVVDDEPQPSAEPMLRTGPATPPKFSGGVSPGPQGSEQ